MRSLLPRTGVLRPRRFESAETRRIRRLPGLHLGSEPIELFFCCWFKAKDVILDGGMRPNPFSIAGSLGCYVWLKKKKEQKSFHTVATVLYFRLCRFCLRFHCFVKCLFYSPQICLRHSNPVRCAVSTASNWSDWIFSALIQL